jgi:hypothetical protein
MAFILLMLLAIITEGQEFSAYKLRKWSLAVRARDSVCVMCFSDEKLEAHHILPKAKFPDSAYMMVNGITLCDPCHLLVHKKDRHYKIYAPMFFDYTLSKEDLDE